MVSEENFKDGFSKLVVGCLVMEFMDTPLA